jgi:hypothetical protein
MWNFPSKLVLANLLKATVYKLQSGAYLGVPRYVPRWIPSLVRIPDIYVEGAKHTKKIRNKKSTAHQGSRIS